MAHYLDHAATTPMRSTAVDAMLPLMRDGFGNPSGAHRLAREANRVVDEAREVLADAVGAEPGDVIFTAGGTEADNLAIFGVFESGQQTVLCSATEHHAVLDPVEHLDGVIAPVGPDGIVDLDALGELLERHDVGLVSVMTVNNETGIVQPIDAIGELIAHVSHATLLHTDAVQALSWIDVAETCARADLISLSAHKFGGPKGVGVLISRERAQLVPRFHGGGQERGRRGGTQNVAGIAGMAAAAAEAVTQRDTEVDRVSTLRDDLVRRIVDGCETSVHVTAHSSATSANIAHLCFEDLESEALLFLLEKHDVMASAASSCSSGALEPSHVLAAMNIDRNVALGSLRLSLGHTSTAADVDAGAQAVVDAVGRLTEMGS